MSERGTQLKTEFRYLTAQDTGKLQLEFLPDDQDKPAGFGSRYLSHVEHRSDFADNWRAQVDFTDVSDDGYLSELGSDFNNQSDTQLNRHASLSYFGADVRSDIRLQGFEILGNYADTYSYAALPQWDLQSARHYNCPPASNSAGTVNIPTLPMTMRRLNRLTGCIWNPHYACLM